MSNEDLRFLYQHAADYAQPQSDPDRACDYAGWYLDQYAYEPDATMDDMPAHTYAWPRFLDSLVAA